MERTSFTSPGGGRRKAKVVNVNWDVIKNDTDAWLCEPTSPTSRAEKIKQLEASSSRIQNAFSNRGITPIEYTNLRIQQDFIMKQIALERRMKQEESAETWKQEVLEEGVARASASAGETDNSESWDGYDNCHMTSSYYHTASGCVVRPEEPSAQLSPRVQIQQNLWEAYCNKKVEDNDQNDQKLAPSCTTATDAARMSNSNVFNGHVDEHDCDYEERMEAAIEASRRESSLSMIMTDEDLTLGEALEASRKEKSLSMNIIGDDDEDLKILEALEASRKEASLSTITREEEESKILEALEASWKEASLSSMRRSDEEDSEILEALEASKKSISLSMHNNDDKDSKAFDVIEALGRETSLPAHVRDENDSKILEATAASRKEAALPIDPSDEEYNYETALQKALEMSEVETKKNHIDEEKELRRILELSKLTAQKEYSTMKKLEQLQQEKQVGPEPVLLQYSQHSEPDIVRRSISAQQRFALSKQPSVYISSPVGPTLKKRLSIQKATPPCSLGSSTATPSTKSTTICAPKVSNSHEVQPTSQQQEKDDTSKSIEKNYIGVSSANKHKGDNDWEEVGQIPEEQQENILLDQYGVVITPSDCITAASSVSFHDASTTNDFNDSNGNNSNCNDEKNVNENINQDFRGIKSITISTTTTSTDGSEQEPEQEPEEERNYVQEKEQEHEYELEEEEEEEEEQEQEQQQQHQQKNERHHEQEKKQEQERNQEKDKYQAKVEVQEAKGQVENSKGANVITSTEFAGQQIPSPPPQPCLEISSDVCKSSVAATVTVIAKPPLDIIPDSFPSPPPPRSPSGHLPKTIGPSPTRKMPHDDPIEECDHGFLRNKNKRGLKKTLFAFGKEGQPINNSSHHTYDKINNIMDPFASPPQTRKPKAGTLLTKPLSSPCSLGHRAVAAAAAAEATKVEAKADDSTASPRSGSSTDISRHDINNNDTYYQKGQTEEQELSSQSESTSRCFPGFVLIPPEEGGRTFIPPPEFTMLDNIETSTYRRTLRGNEIAEF